jgi:septal ring factor EnvC (AmiA/AmiB activator)
VYAAPFTGFGNLIILDHGNRAFSLYGYLDRLDIARGDRVAPGNVVGSVGLATGGQPALYFELRVDGQPVDPLQWLKGTAF